MTNPAAAEHTASDPVASRNTRRALLGLGALGAALAAAKTASAAGSADTGLAAFAIGAELAASDLYASVDGDLWALFGDHHLAAAQRMAGIAGLSADTRNDALFDALSGAFGSDTEATALELENTLAATHTELLGAVSDETLLMAIASIIAAESRHAAVIAQQSGAGLDAALTNAAAPLAPEA